MRRHDELGLNRLTLRFEGELEEGFQAEYRHDAVMPLRILSLLYAADQVAGWFVALQDQSTYHSYFILWPILALILAGLMSLPRAVVFVRPLAILTFVMVLGLWLPALYELRTPHPLADTYLAAWTYMAKFSLLLAAMFVFSRVGFLVECGMAVVATGVWIETFLTGLHDASPLSFTGAFEILFTLIVAAVALAAAGYFLERYARRDFAHRALLAAERERSERLLLNVLPAPVADRLKLRQELIADAFEDITVLFADVVQFTNLAASLSADQVVGILDTVFTVFDGLSTQFGLEKIKTIGDCYMVVGGLPVPREDHVEALADMALAMQASVKELNAQHGWNLAFRIGLHCGPAVAGVIGRQKFIYDLWGDTVNTASRMESHGIPGEIQVTEAVYERLAEKFEFVLRGRLEVKGKGLMDTYLLQARRATPIGRGSADSTILVQTA